MTDLRHGACAAGFKRTLSLFPHQPLSATTLFHFEMKGEIYIRQLGPVFGAHEGFLKRCSDVQPTNQPSETGLSTFFHSVMTESFHRISGKSWKSRPDSGDSKAPTTPLTFSSSPVVSQHIWPSLGWQNLHMNMEEISFNHNMLVRMCDMWPRILKAFLFCRLASFITLISLNRVTSEQGVTHIVSSDSNTQTVTLLHA